MESTILLNASENTHFIEEEEKSRFIRNILEVLGVDANGQLSEYWEPNGILTVEGKIKLRSLLSSHDIQIIDNLGGEMKIYIKSEGHDKLIAEWKKCHYKLKKDPAQVDPNKRLYLEMTTSFWSFFDEE